MKNAKICLILLFAAYAVTGCKKDIESGGFEKNVDYFAVKDKPRFLWNELDTLCDSIHKEFGVKVIYEFSPRIISGINFFVPAQYKKALDYTRIVLKGFWLKPLKERFPLYFSKETPIEFMIIGGLFHPNTITNPFSTAGAGENAQFYRLGMGDVNNFDKRNKSWLVKHMATLYHEHAHQQDAKYGRGYLYDKVSTGSYYALTFNKRTIQEANRDGFFEPYGGYAPEEDFATTVEAMATFPKSKIDSMVNISAKLKKKYQMVHKFYLDKGMDLHKLQPVLDSVINRTNY